VYGQLLVALHSQLRICMKRSLMSLLSGQRNWTSCRVLARRGPQQRLRRHVEQYLRRNWWTLSHSPYCSAVACDARQLLRHSPPVPVDDCAAPHHACTQMTIASLHTWVSQANIRRKYRINLMIYTVSQNAPPDGDDDFVKF